MNHRLLASLILLSLFASAHAAEDTRQRVELPEMMQHHMMANMRDHLATINEILSLLDEGKLDEAAGVAESRLGMSALEKHGARHMAKFMPEGMQKAAPRCTMRRAASPEPRRRASPQPPIAH